jgi:hypothetical protein
VLLEITSYLIIDHEDVSKALTINLNQAVRPIPQAYNFSNSLADFEDAVRIQVDCYLRIGGEDGNDLCRPILMMMYIVIPSID